MRKKNTLYTVSRYNLPMFMPENKRLFLGGGDFDYGAAGDSSSLSGAANSIIEKNFMKKNPLRELYSKDKMATPLSGGYVIPVGSLANAADVADKSARTMDQKQNKTAGDPNFPQTAGSIQAVTAPKQESKVPGLSESIRAVSTLAPFLNVGKGLTQTATNTAAQGAAKTVASTAAKSGIKVGTGAAKTGGEAVLKGTIGSGKAINGGVNAASTAANTGKFASALGASKLGSLGSAGVGIAGSLVGMGANKLISNGYDTTAGNLVSDIGGTIGGVVGYFNPVIGAIVSAATGAIGGVVNRGFGMKTDGQALASAKDTAARNTAIAQSDNIFDAAADLSSAYTDPYEGGWFRQGDEEYNNWKVREDVNRSVRDVENALYNKSHDILRDAYYNSSAYGGPIETMPNNDDMGAINYGFMSDYLTMKGQNNQNKNQITSLFAGTPSTMFDLGGVLQTHGSDWGSGLTHINAGGSHESNPNDGIQMGVDNEGTPNLVEEDETVWNDYVFSNRIFADEETKSKFHLPKKKDITYAEISKKLEKEIAERPNDAVSRAGFNAQMQTLEEQQERQKAEMEAARAREAFEALSPEEQTAVMQNAAQQEAMAQQAAQEQAIAQQQAMQQPSPEEAAMMQQQISPEEQAMLQQQQLSQMQANVSALGGQLVKAGDVEGNENLYAFAGRMKKRAAKKYDADWFKQMGSALGITEDEMKEFLENINPNDPDANMTAFNAIYRTNQENAARKRYVDAQRKSKKNELFDSKTGRFRKSDDGSKIYEAQYRQEGQDWISPDKIISQEEYSKLSDKDKEAFKQIKTKIGDKLYDYNGKLMESLYDGDENSILDSYNYDEGFKWDPKEAQTLQYPVEMEHSNLSKLRYVPALGGAVGLLNDVLTPPDYSRAEDVINAGRGLMTPKMVDPHYIGNYLTYRPMDIWYQQNALNAQSRATDRALLNSNSPSRAAGLLANGYNSQLASGNLYRQALEYNDALEKQVEDFNRGTNIFNAQADMNTQQANQNALLHSGRLGLQGIIAGNQMKEDVDARKGASMSANLTNLMQSIGNIGEEAYDEDRLKWLEGTGVLRSDYFNRGKYGTSAAKGGKLKKKKRGLTI